MRSESFKSKEYRRVSLLLSARNSVDEVIDLLIKEAMEPGTGDIIGDDYYEYLIRARDELNREIGSRLL